MEISLNTPFTFDNILIEPKSKSRVKSRAMAKTTTSLYGIELPMPVISASMSLFDTFHNDISTTFAQVMYTAGGLHIFSRGSPLKDRLDIAKTISGTGIEFGIAVSYQELLDNQTSLEDLDSFISIDIANGAILDEIIWQGRYPLILGNFGNPGAVQRTDFHGDIIYKLGIGSGAGCTTRIVTGVGAPQGWLVREAASRSARPIISDGGIKNPGDFVKALALGANAVMMGHMFASAVETPWLPVKLEDGKWYKPYRGMSSSEEKKSVSHVEGVSGYIPYYGKTVKDIMQELSDGLRSAMSYVDSFNLAEFRKNVEFLIIPPNDIETQSRIDG